MASPTSTEEKAANSKSNITAEPGGPAAPKRKKRRWLRRLLITLGVLILVVGLLVALLPTLLSTGPGRSMIVGIINGQIRGTAKIDDLSLSWFSPCQAAGLSVADPDGKPVLVARRVQWDQGLWHALSSGVPAEQYGQLTVESPQGNLHFRDDGSLTFLDAFAMRQTQPSKPSQPSKASVIVVVTNGQIQADRPDGRSYLVSDIATRLALKSMNDLQVELTAILNGSSKATATVSLRDFYQGGKFDLAKATGQLAADTEATDLQPVFGIAMNGVRGQGMLAVNAKGSINAGSGSAKFSTVARGVSATTSATQPATQIDGELNGDFAFESGTIKANAIDFVSHLGKVHASGRYATGQSLDTVSFDYDKLVAALTEGKPFELPDFALKVAGKLDMVAVSQSIPALVPKLREDVKITEGSLDLNDIQVSGGAHPAASGSVKLSLTGQRTGQSPVVMDPLDGTLKLTSEGNAVKLELAQLKSGFVNLDAKGSLPQLSAKFHADLYAARQQLDEFFNLDDVNLSGTVEGTVNATPDESQRGKVTLGLGVTCTNVAYSTGTPPVTRPSPRPGTPGSRSAQSQPEGTTAQIVWKGTLVRSPGKLVLVGDLTDSKLNVADFGDVLGPDKATIHHELTFNFQKQKVDLDVATLKLDSHLLTLDIKGPMNDLANDCLLNLSGTYAARWPELMAFLHRVFPDIAKKLDEQAKLAMVGASSGHVKLDGPIRNPSIGLAAGTDVGWDSGSKAMGLTLGKAAFGLTYKDGRLVLANGTTSANGGTLRLAGMVDTNGNDQMAGPGKDAVLKIDGELVVLDNVALNEEVGKYLLSRILPLLAETNKLEGKVSLTLRDVHIPLSNRVLQVGQGSGHLDLSNLRLQPAGEFGKLMKMLELGADVPYPVKISAFDFQLRDGAFRFQELKVTIAETLDLIFRGQVRFDDTVDLIVSVPIRPALLGEVFKGAGITSLPVLGDAAKALEGIRIDIPITGTRLFPKLDMATVSKVDGKKLFEQLIKKGIQLPIPGKGVLPPLPGGGPTPKLPELPHPDLPKLPKLPGS